MISSIPSPSSGVLKIGPLSIHAYGLMIALGVVVAIWLIGRRAERAGTATREQMSSAAMWGVLAGIIGARLYYVATDASEPWREPAKWLRIWEGGLGIPGGLLAGVLVGLWRARRLGIPVSGVLTAVAPAIPLAQSIGRWGNWWNQELYGRATTLPWGLEIDEYPGTLFHPTFLYESLWNLALCGALILADRKWRPRGLFAWYVLGYSVGRFWIEGLRIDAANSGGGLRLNQWTALVAGAVALASLVIGRRRVRSEACPPTASSTSSDSPESLSSPSTDPID